ncbi:hypothetical protein A2572_00575 [Candidatus Collierbacteria bacterium RIFOXYD1_FULL_40_9]|uniref:Prepilin-type N-terminal cleavage/methylation domain-containing protein n=1 Tax=Candidatus Collierbacteria bacterium RIFOXYD1_FULL_40_9 TaxID=1817731 RepID=A0A1F5FWL7_9BACT|nr:MAG: hypothetical protein A2572_00575 [Candidatus Collierbacteria bacterium RIFOXYD1_FULL_40_9]
MKGFTLIELLITITIVVLVTGTAIAAYITFNESRQLDIDTRSVLSLLNKVRSRAIFLEYPADCTGLTSFGFESAVGTSGLSDSVRFFANCAEGVRGEETAKVLEAAVFSTAFSMSFLPSSGAIASYEDQTITISSTKGGQKSKNIIVSSVMNSVNRVVDN